MPTFTTVMTEEEYQVLRNATMRGKFLSDFSRDFKNNVEFKVKPREVNIFFEEMEELFDSGESSWREILKN